MPIKSIRTYGGDAVTERMLGLRLMRQPARTPKRYGLQQAQSRL